MKKRHANITLSFFEDGTEQINVQTNDVPITMIIEGLNTLVKSLAHQILTEAGEDIPPNMLEGYMNSRIDLDREVLKKLIKNS